MKCSPLVAGLKQFTLVYYVPEPLLSSLNELVGDIYPFNQPKPHITLLPPRPLRVPLETASEQVRVVLSRFVPFTVELSSVQLFAGTNVLYLAVGKGLDHLHRLYNNLNTGPLEHEEEYEFLPHLTLSGPIAGYEIDRIRKRAEILWNSMPSCREFIVDHAVFLSLNETETRDWRTVWVENLHRVQTAQL